MADKQQPGEAAPSPLREQLQALIAEHGYEAVTEALMKVLEKHFRLQDLQAAARKLGLIPPTVGRLERHTAESVKTNNN